MGEELVVIPRGELQRALRVATKKTHDGGALLALGLSALVGAFVIQPVHVLIVCVLAVGGLTTSIIGGVRLLHARRSKLTIESKLREQQLPPARVI